eukprot:NODE_2008_length_1307_cov_22.895763_g1911_i0.p1 GENE.NODE_2008_length_1307_cov_22.895763_g1911_i0~~NODE_2008_length_1307_cov_22.895763_g1911_i0.p1  ORF type:complete len:373 (-),score=14.01 NODE_2008_length_1307_cov_22.895763_g1911_i0:136-1254(-)
MAPPVPSTVAAGRYLVMERIGRGRKNQIFHGLDRSTNSDVVIKFQNHSRGPSGVLNEYNIYCELHRPNRLPGFPQALWFGIDNRHHVIVMDRLGPNLADLQSERTSKRFETNTVIRLADQMLSRIELVHSKGILHRDIKPQNFVMGLGPQSNQVYLIDFGLSCRWRDPQGNHLPQRSGQGYVGTAKYSSVNSHSGRSQSRRDDLEGFIFVLVSMARGKLPWDSSTKMFKKNIFKMKMNKNGAEKRASIRHMKEQTTIGELCRGLDPAFGHALKYIRSLAYEQTPDYNHIRHILSTAGSDLDIDGQRTTIVPPTQYYGASPAPRSYTSEMSSAVGYAPSFVGSQGGHVPSTPYGYPAASPMNIPMRVPIAPIA